MSYPEHNSRVVLLMIAIFFLSITCSHASATYIPPTTTPTSETAAINDDNNFLGRDYFERFNFNKTMRIQFELNPSLEYYLSVGSMHLNKSKIDTHLLFWGNRPQENTNGTPRYFGYNYYGAYITNPLLDDDRTFSDTIESKNWFVRPWNQTEIASWLSKRNEPPIEKNEPYDGNPDFRPNIVKGLQLARQDKFLNNTQIPWEQYVHILQPPTNFGWGMGRMWHKDKVNGGIYYISVPLVPRCVIDSAIPNLYVKDIDPGATPTYDQSGNPIYEAQVGKKYTAKVTYGLGRLTDRSVNLSEVLPYLAGMHQINDYPYHAELVKQAGNGTINPKRSQYPDKITQQRAHTVSFSQQGNEITASFDWTPQMGTQQLIAAINDGHYVAKRHIFEIETAQEKGDNVKAVPIKVIPPPDLFVKAIQPGTDLPEPGVVYEGTVSFGIKPGYKEKVVAEVRLTHNTYAVPGVHGQILTFEPGKEQVLSLPFRFTGMGLGTNSTLVAEIIPKEPTSADLYPQDNTKTVVVRSNVVDVAAINIEQVSPVIKGTNEAGKAVFHNYGPDSETFTAHIYAGDQLVFNSPVTVPSGKSVAKYFKWTVPDREGTIELKALADPLNKLKDKNRGNNSFSKTVPIVASPPPPLYCSNATNVPEHRWVEWYEKTTPQGKTTIPVNYQERINTNIYVNTKQGPSHPQFPPAELRESRGRWEIEKWANARGLDPNQVTRAGYGFEVKVVTEYVTNYEQPPAGCDYHNRPVLDLSGLSIEFFDTKGRSVEIVDMECTSVNKGRTGSMQRTIMTWQLPLKTVTLSDNTRVTERKHYVDVKNTDGIYEMSITGVGPIGVERQLMVCNDTNAVTIYGSMYDDIYTKPKID